MPDESADGNATGSTIKASSDRHLNATSHEMPSVPGLELFFLGYWAFGSFDPVWARTPYTSLVNQAGDVQSGTTAVAGLVARRGLPLVASNWSANHEPRAVR